MSNEGQTLLQRENFTTSTFLGVQISKKRKILIIAIFTAILITFICTAIVIGVKSTNKPSPKLPENFQTDLLDLVSANQISSFMEEFSSMSHIAGSTNDHEQAINVKAKFEDFGLKARIDEIPVLLNYPLTRLVEIVYPEDKKFVCSMKEAVIPEDPTSGKPAIDTFNGYSNSGEATGELVYANYGREEDYKLLDDLNVNLTGKIVIVRYGKIFRGNKAAFAEERGAVGVLIYVDPADTGFKKGPVYPEGPWSTNTTVQRGSVWTGNGDPTTPGWPSSFTGPRLTEAQARDPNIVESPLPKIPIQPLSYGDAAPLLAAITVGDLPDPSWQGGLDFDYKIGPGSVQVHINLSMNFTVTPIWNVIATIEGEVEPDRLVLLGSHRDAWTFGAGDPISGTSVLLEVARVFGKLVGEGWKPRRTIVICSWDAEEYGLIGSVEFVEKYYESLFARAAIYLNVDIAVRGGDYFYAEGSPNLLNILLSETNKVPFVDYKVADIWDKKLGLLGSGSDFTGFIQHVGVSSIDLGMSGDPDSYAAVYHSNYDSYYWYKHFGDPDFSAHAAVAKVFGLLGMKFASDNVLPFHPEDYVTALYSYIDALENETNVISFQSMKDSLVKLSASVTQLSSEINLAKSEESFSSERLRSLNDKLMLMERTFLGDKQTSGREWYRHVIFAPSLTNSYAGKAFPALYDAIIAKDWDTANFLVGRFALILEGTAHFLSPVF